MGKFRSFRLLPVLLLFAMLLFPAPAQAATLVISAPLVQATMTSATVTWNTNLKSNSWVEFGLTPTYGDDDNGQNDAVTSHRVELTPLEPNQKYYYRIRTKVGQGEPVLYAGDFTTQPVKVSIVARATELTTDDSAVFEVFATPANLVSKIRFYRYNQPNPTWELPGTGDLRIWKNPEEGSHRMMAVAYDAKNRKIGETSVTITVTKPQVQISNLTQHVDGLSVTLNWRTNYPASGKVDYGLTESYGQSKPEETAATTDHEIQVTGLTPGLTYQYRVTSEAKGTTAVKTGSFSIRSAPIEIVLTVDEADREIMLGEAIPFTVTVTPEGLAREVRVSARGERPIAELELNAEEGTWKPLESWEPWRAGYFILYADAWDVNQRWLGSSGEVLVRVRQEVTITLGEPDVGTTSATIPWETDPPTTGYLTYGTDPDSLNQRAASTSGTSTSASHSVTLGSLEPGTTYYYEVKATGPDGETYTSDPGEFTTLEEPETEDPEIEDPAGTLQVVAWSEPGMAEVGDSVTLHAQAPGGEGLVDRIRFLLEGEEIDSFGGASGGIDWEAAGEGTIVIAVQAVDEDGQVLGETTVTVQVQGKEDEEEEDGSGAMETFELTVADEARESYTLRLNWDAPDGASSYEIRWQTAPEVTLANSELLAAGLIYPDYSFDLPPGTLGYQYFRVYAYNAREDLIGYSEVAAVAIYPSGLVVRMHQDEDLTDTYPEADAAHVSDPSLYQAPVWFIPVSSRVRSARCSTRHTCGDFLRGVPASAESAVIDPYMVRRLDELESSLGPVGIISAYRTPEMTEDTEIDGTFSRHQWGDAVDISYGGSWSEVTRRLPLVGRVTTEPTSTQQGHYHLDWRETTLLRGYRNWALDEDLAPAPESDEPRAEQQPGRMLAMGEIVRGEVGCCGELRYALPVGLDGIYWFRGTSAEPIEVALLDESGDQLAWYLDDFRFELFAELEAGETYILSVRYSGVGEPVSFTLQAVLDSIEHDLPDDDYLEGWRVGYNQRTGLLEAYHPNLDTDDDDLPRFHLVVYQGDTPLYDHLDAFTVIRPFDGESEEWADMFYRAWPLEELFVDWGPGLRFGVAVEGYPVDPASLVEVRINRARPDTAAGARISREGLRALKEHEGFHADPYPNALGQCAIGFGTVISAGPCTAAEYQRFAAGMDEDGAEQLLLARVWLINRLIDSTVKVDLNLPQREELISYIYRVGEDAFLSSEVLAALQEGK